MTGSMFCSDILQILDATMQSGALDLCTYFVVNKQYFEYKLSINPMFVCLNVFLGVKLQSAN
jgi:hypothetical protein